jgi:hypothetical protein
MPRRRRSIADVRNPNPSDGKDPFLTKKLSEEEAMIRDAARA